MASNYALIKRLDESSDCKIEMWSKNNEGISADKSVLVVPKHTDVNLLESFTQFDRSNETILSWQTTQKFKYNITDHFNIFACDSWNHLLQQCDVCSTVLKAKVTTVCAFRANLKRLNAFASKNRITARLIIKIIKL